MKNASVIGVALVLAGCAAPPPLTPERAAALEAPICRSAVQCASAWQATQIWLVNNSRWKIQMANDAVIQTHGPSGIDSTEVAYTVTREPTTEGYRLRMRAACDNIFGCLPKSPSDRIIDYNNYMRLIIK